MHAGVQKIAMDHLAGAYKDMPDVIMLDTVGIVNLVDAGLLLDMTEYWEPIAHEFVEGAVADATINGRVWALPDAVRPQLLFYNAEIFEKYDIDPAMMSTFDGYLEAGRLLKERSNGEVYLSYIDTGTYTWRYWGRRGLMPQAHARIWDDDGNGLSAATTVPTGPGLWKSCTMRACSTEQPCSPRPCMKPLTRQNSHLLHRRLLG